MEQGDPEVGLESPQRPLEPVGQHLGVADERLHLRFAEVTAVRATKAAAKSLGAGDADPNAVDIERDRLPFEHPDVGVLQNPAHLLLAPGVIVVVAKDGDRRDGQAAQLVGQDRDLLRAAAAGQVTGEEQKVGAVG